MVNFKGWLWLRGHTHWDLCKYVLNFYHLLFVLTTNASFLRFSDGLSIFARELMFMGRLVKLNKILSKSVWNYDLKHKHYPLKTEHPVKLYIRTHIGMSLYLTVEYLKNDLSSFKRQKPERPAGRLVFTLLISPSSNFSTSPWGKMLPWLLPLV